MELRQSPCLFLGFSWAVSVQPCGLTTLLLETLAMTRVFDSWHPQRRWKTSQQNWKRHSHMKTQENTYFVCVLLGFFRKTYVRPFSYWHWRSPFQCNSERISTNCQVGLSPCFGVSSSNGQPRKTRGKRDEPTNMPNTRLGEEETKQACTNIDKTRQDKTRQKEERKRARERERTNGSNSLWCWIKGATDTTVYSDFSFAIVFLSFSNPEKMK